MGPFGPAEDADIRSSAYVEVKREARSRTRGIDPDEPMDRHSRGRVTGACLPDSCLAKVSKGSIVSWRICVGCCTIA